MWFSTVLSWQTCYFWIAAPTKKTENGVKYRFDLPVNARKWVIRPKTKQKRGCSQTKWGNQFCISYICQTSQYLGPEWERRCTIEGRSLGHSDQSSPDRWSRRGLTGVSQGRKQKCDLSHWFPSQTESHWWSPWKHLWGGQIESCSCAQGIH